MIPTGEELRISSSDALQGSTAEKTLSSRIRRAISCEYCAPKSRTTIDGVSTDECLRSWEQCKGAEDFGPEAGFAAFRTAPREFRGWTPHGVCGTGHWAERVRVQREGLADRFRDGRPGCVRRDRRNVAMAEWRVVNDQGPECR